MVNQSFPLPGRSWPATSSGAVLPKNHHRFAKSRRGRNSFDCVVPRAVRSACWVRDRHHVGSSHRILRLHERRHFHRPRRRRLPVAAAVATLASPRFTSRRGSRRTAAPNLAARASSPVASFTARTSLLSRWDSGRVAEWFKAPVLKTGVPARVPWVRIPPLPPAPLKSFINFELFASAPTHTHTRRIGRCR